MRACVRVCVPGRVREHVPRQRWASHLLPVCPHSRLVMSTHRDLEAIRRLPSRRARPARKGPAPCTAKAVGGLHRGEQSWRDV